MRTWPIHSVWLIPQVLVVGLQIACAIHVLKRGRDYWWLFIILFFPFIGSVIYLVVEVIPELRSGGAGLSLNLKSTRRRIRERKEELAYSETVENRAKLAREYMRAGQYAEAIATYKPCLDGPHKDDPYVLFGLAQVYYQSGNFGEAEKMLAELSRLNIKDSTHERQLLGARVLEGLGRRDEAIREYESLARVYAGEEARCRQALFLKKTGHHKDAAAIFRDIVAKARRADRFFRRQQREWIQIAKKNLK